MRRMGIADERDRRASLGRPRSALARHDGFLGVEASVLPEQLLILRSIEEGRLDVPGQADDRRLAFGLWLTLRTRRGRGVGRGRRRGLAVSMVVDPCPTRPLARAPPRDAGTPPRGRRGRAGRLRLDGLRDALVRQEGSWAGSVHPPRRLHRDLIAHLDEGILWPGSDAASEGSAGIRLTVVRPAVATPCDSAIAASVT